jgi:hypothetical protein
MAGRKPNELPTSRDDLSPEPERLNDAAVSLDILGLHVVQESSAPPDQHQKSSAGMMILFMNLEMLGQIFNAMGQQSDLNLRRSGIAFVKLEPPD